MKKCHTWTIPAGVIVDGFGVGAYDVRVVLKEGGKTFAEDTNYVVITP